MRMCIYLVFNAILFSFTTIKGNVFIATEKNVWNRFYDFRILSTYIAARLYSAMLIPKSVEEVEIVQTCTQRGKPEKINICYIFVKPYKNPIS